MMMAAGSGDSMIQDDGSTILAADGSTFVSDGLGDDGFCNPCPGADSPCASSHLCGNCCSAAPNKTPTQWIAMLTGFSHSCDSARQFYTGSANGIFTLQQNYIPTNFCRWGVQLVPPPSPITRKAFSGDGCTGTETDNLIANMTLEIAWNGLDQLVGNLFFDSNAAGAFGPVENLGCNRTYVLPANPAVSWISGTLTVRPCS